MVTSETQPLISGQVSTDSPSRLKKFRSVFRHSRPPTSDDVVGSLIDKPSNSNLRRSITTPAESLPQVTRGSSISQATTEESEVEEVSKVSSSDNYPNYFAYITDLISHAWLDNVNNIESNDEKANKSRQLRLIMFEALKHFAFVTDFLVLMRLYSGVFDRTRRNYETVATVLLSGIFVSSVVGYMTRMNTIVHKIKDSDQWIFCPGIPFYNQVRRCGHLNPGVLLMYERLQWTYSLVMRVLEDLPRLFVVLCLLAQDSGFLLIVDASTSLMVLVASSFRMGSLYPYKSSLALLISSAPPIENPILLEASPTTRKFPWLVAFTFLVMTICHIICARVMRLHYLQYWFYSLMAMFCFLISFCASMYASYLTRQYKLYAVVNENERNGEVNNR